jgi:hypothetical protein
MYMLLRATHTAERLIHHGHLRLDSTLFASTRRQKFIIEEKDLLGAAVLVLLAVRGQSEHFG